MEQREQTLALRWPWVVLVLACVGSGRAFCQDPLDYVPNLPYTAHFEQTYFDTEPDGTRVEHQRRLVTMRDSQGRTRIETFPPLDLDCCRGGVKPDNVNLYLPLQRQFIQLFPSRKRASVMTFAGAGPIPRHFDPNDKNIKREGLPGKTINGIYSEGTRTTFSNGCVEEIWVSPDMKVGVLTNYGGTCDSGGVAEIRELDRSEPDPTLFEIPTDWKIVTATAGPQ